MTQAIGLTARIPSGAQVSPAHIALAGIPQTAMPRRFVVEVIYGRDSSGTIAEIAIDETELPAIIDGISTGQFSRIVRVFELRDVSREIAQLVADHMDAAGDSPTEDLAGFLELYGVTVPASEAAA